MTRPIAYPPIDPIAAGDAWTQKLTAIAAEPLAFCPGFPEIAARYEAWWQTALIDRPLFLASRTVDPARPFSKHFDLLIADGDRWFEESLADLENTHFCGDALPNIRVDFGPVILGGLLGAKTEFGAGTTWTHAFIDDAWSNAPDWTIDEEGPFWKTLLRLMDVVSADAKGRYLVRTPDWGGSADVLLNLRGSAGLCMDVLDRPGVVKAAVDAIYPAWRKAYTRCHEICLGNGAGIIHWIGLWSNAPYLIPACDFNYLIGPREFNELLLPDIARQTATAGRGVFHLDGSGATNHIDALLEVPEIRAIQYVTGAGTPDALPWLDMFRKIQTAGRSLVLLCLNEEIPTLLDELEPEGLCFCPVGSRTGVSVDDVFAAMCKRFL